MNLTEEQTATLDLETLTPEQLQKFKYNLLKGKKLGKEVNLFWDSAKLGTYDPENKQPMNNFKWKNMSPSSILEGVGIA